MFTHFNGLQDHILGENEPHRRWDKFLACPGIFCSFQILVTLLLILVFYIIMYSVYPVLLLFNCLGFPL